METMDLMDRLFAYLSEHDVTLTEVPKKQSFAIQKRWTSVFGGFKNGTPHKHGSRAIDQFLAEPAQSLILLFLSSRITAFPISTNHRPCAAYSYTGKPVDVSNFHELEFAVFPESYAWTLVHTHEDWSLGGPYLVRADDVAATNA